MVKKHKVIVVKAPHTFEVVDIECSQNDLGAKLREIIGGWLEVVHPVLLPKPYLFVCDEEGLYKDYELNVVGTLLYNAPDTKPEDLLPIVGTIVIMAEGLINGEHDIVGLNENDIKILNEGILGKIKKAIGVAGGIASRLFFCTEKSA